MCCVSCSFLIFGPCRSARRVKKTEALGVTTPVTHHHQLAINMARTTRLATLAAALAGFTGLTGLASAQFPPPREGITWVRSQHHEGISLSYKNPQICETTPGVKSYSGYVHLPPHTVDHGPLQAPQDYPINTFFWFVEARSNPHRAPLTIWLNGGPGASSLLGMLSENGPCIIGPDSNSSTLNPWSWNNEVNVLYIDQPVQVGFSYDELVNGTYALLDSNAMEGDEATSPIHVGWDGEEQNTTFLVGTFASQNSTRLPNSTAAAAVALWHFAQTWFEE